MALQSYEIRDLFYKYFESKDHKRVSSASLVPANDPSLLFTNAGMVPFKDIFLGRESSPMGPRAVSCQKCVRAGGKHNDLENVGFTARHHTFFEMLGNFSFGDYFKKQAINYAWEFSTKILGLPAEKIYASVFKDDDESWELWVKEIGLPEERVVRLGEKDNFWAMGDTGPCGPCSELYIDRGQSRCTCPVAEKSKCGLGSDCERYLEYWNLVFMQYVRDEKGELSPLPKPSVDTGAGLERLCSIIQDGKTNYDTDLFYPLLKKIENLLGSPAKDEAQTSAFRVIADHARASAFLIADGVMPSNEGRGYVLRRILRRAVRFGQKLGFEKPFLFKVAGEVVDFMGGYYPELRAQAALIQKCIESEERQFLETLETGLSLLGEALKKLGKNEILPGALAFKLYDTFGFPLDLTEVICAEVGRNVDHRGFEDAMALQKSQSRKNWKGSGDTSTQDRYHQLIKSLGKNHSQFTGYSSLSGDGKAVDIFESDPDNGHFEVVFDQTPFYAESGGQVSDFGEISSPTLKARVVDVRKPLPNLIVHTLEVEKGSLVEGESYHLKVDAKRRSKIAKNHSATHLLHLALQKILGSHVKQAGSLVHPEYLRFDFTHFQALSPDEKVKIEDLVNAEIWEAQSVGVEEMAKDKALAKGAMAMFGEKYGEQVRVVTVGGRSIELCGGTHVSSTSDINLFKIVSESSVAAGVRRIVALSSEAAFASLRQDHEILVETSELLKVQDKLSVPKRLEGLLEQEKAFKNQLSQWESQAVEVEASKLLALSKPLGIAEIQIIVHQAHIDDAALAMKSLRELSDLLKAKNPNLTIALFSVHPKEKKIFSVIASGKKAMNHLPANLIIKELCPLMGAKGGGKGDQAQAGGDKFENIGEIIKSFPEIAKQIATRASVK